MDSYDVGPTRPPRATKIHKESSGLLISVIRSLSASQDNAERNREKAKLEKDFKRSDQSLDDLLSVHHEDLVTTMQSFSKISNRITASRERILSIKEKLSTCKMLLNCKRDELKKLWLESVEHSHVLHLLDEIESLTEVSEKIDNFSNKKHYLHATQLLVSSVTLLEEGLEGVEALNDIRKKLGAQRENMYRMLVDELHRQIYVRSTAEVLRRYRLQGIEKKRAESNSATNSPAKLSGSVLDITAGHSPSRRNSRDHGKNAFCLLPAIPDEAPTEDTSLSEPDESPFFIAIIVECLALLSKTPEAVEKIKAQCQKELLAIARRTAQHVTENGSTQVNGHLETGSNANLLTDLLQLIFEQFRCTTAVHEAVLANFKRSCRARSHPGEIALYDMADIWSKVQAVLEIIVGEYLDIHNTTMTQQPTFTEVTASSDISSYFARKRSSKPKTFHLFRFDSSSHAMSMNAYFQEQKQAMNEKNDITSDINVQQQLFVCQPAAKNITIMFNLLMKFIGEIEHALGLEEGTHCPLHAFLNECIKVFLGQVNVEVENIIDTATKSLDSWHTVTESETLKSLMATKPLLQSTVYLYKHLQELRLRMQALPMYSEHFLTLICNVLQNYKEICQGAYRGIVQPESEDKRIISANWATDKDIYRFLKSMPNWLMLMDQQDDIRNQDLEESPEEIRLRNKQETEMLLGNLAGNTLIPAHEILGDVGQLRILAQLQESMEWFSSRMTTFAQGLTSQVPAQLSPLMRDSESESSTVPEISIKSLTNLASAFAELADKCLIILHVEIRVLCFFYLKPVAIKGSFAGRVDTQEPDPEVVKLNKDLTAINDAMNATLKSYKMRYMFEGLGHLIASILISSTSSINKINVNGVKKMCRNIFAVQQNLTTITMSREVALDHARQYFELFYQTPEEILNFLVEHGPKFQEVEYINAFQLLHRSDPESEPLQLSEYEKRLRDILNEVPVAV